MKGKQTDIATFFGGKPKAAAPSPSPRPARAAATAAGGSPRGGAADEAAAPEAAAKQHKRLRKAEEEAPQQQQQQQQAVVAAAPEGLEDSSDDDGAAAAAAAKRRRAAVADDDDDDGGAGVAAAVREAVAAEEAAASESELEDEAEDAAGSDGDAAGAAGPSKKPAPKKRKKAAPKSPLGKGAKVDGVGALAVKAAAEHGAFDLASVATWAPGAPVPFAFLADTFEAIAEESKRLAITGMLIGAFRAVMATTPADLLPMVYLCTNRVAPAHAGLELGVGDAALVRALSQATGRKEAAIKKEYDEAGDLGVVAAASRGTQRTLVAPPPLTVAGVFRAFKEVAATEGAKSVDRKRAAIVRLLAAARQGEAGYVTRALQGKLRIGLAEQTVLTALAHAALLQREAAEAAAAAAAGRRRPRLDGEPLANALEEAAQAVKLAYSQCPSYDALVPALLDCIAAGAGGSDSAVGCLAGLPSRVRFTPGVPVKPMLAKPTNGVSEVLDKFSDQEFTCEYKYDGERAQIHVLPGGGVKIYSRNSEDNTGKYPDVAALFPRLLAPGVRDVVLDAEAVAVDRATGKVLPFQVLSTRARKDVALGDVKVPVCVYAFDCLYLNGEDLMGRPLTERRAALAAALAPQRGALELAVAKTSADVEELTAFLDEAVAAGTEGLIVKTLADGYEPSRRSSHWLKLKKDYLEGCGDTFDLVPVGAWLGRGKRAGVYGSYLLAVYDPAAEEYQSITKIGTGFSEELLKTLAEGLAAKAIAAPKAYYAMPEGLTPDVWFEPAQVWEVKAADLSLSPVHRAAAGAADPASARGVSIRFPRLVRVRDDKGPEDATTAEQVAEMYRAQAVFQQKGGKAAGGAGGADDDE